ncbi:hypothetical protein OQA88_11221 [Cercophora sp. LCS_1]
MAFLASQVNLLGGKLRDIIHNSSKVQLRMNDADQTSTSIPSLPELQGSSWPGGYQDGLEAVVTHSTSSEPPSNRLVVFPRNSRETWHRQILVSGADKCLSGERPFREFPFGDLSSATDVYIGKKKLVPDTHQCDVKLEDLILQHHHRDDGVKDIAVLATLHALSYSAGCAQLVSMREEHSTTGAHERFLKCLIWSSYINGSLIHARERRAAESLMQLLTGVDFLEAGQHLFRSLMEENTSPTVLSAPYVTSILNMTRFGSRFQERLDSLQDERRYMSLHNSISWLSSFVGLAETSTAKMVIKAAFPAWEIWTTWRPNYMRLVQWEGGRFTNEQRRQLYRIFDLEGPDTSGYGRGTLKDSPPACFQFVRVANQDQQLLNRVLVLLDKVQLVPGRHAADLYISQVVRRRGSITEELVSRIEAILDTENDECIYAMLLWLTRVSNSPSFNNRMVALTTLLPVLDGHPEVQAILGGDMGNDVMEVMRTARAEYVNQLATGLAENLATRIYDFGDAILASSWLTPSLTREFMQELELLPPRNVMDEIFNSIQRSHPPTDLIRQYLAIIIGGAEGEAGPLLDSIQSHISFWGRGLHPDRANLALALGDLVSVDAEVHDACLQQILREDLILIRDLFAIIRLDNESCCVDLARLLRKRMQMRDGVNECWQALLYALLYERRRGMMEWSAEELTVDEWFQWVADLRDLFPDDEGRLSVADLGFSEPKYVWWDLLSTRYRAAIDQLEVLHKGRGNLRWLWFQELPEISVLLDLLQTPKNTRSPIESFICSYLQPSTHVIGLICASLSAWNQASQAGRTAFESVYTRHKQSLDGEWPESAIEVLVASWEQSEGLSRSDRDGLRVLSELLGLGLSGDDATMSTLRELLMREYSKLADTAQNGETTRSQRGRHAASPRSGDPSDLGSPGPNTAVPDELVDVVEQVGDKQWEMCFPLGSLSAQMKRSLGIGDLSRLLLVRISFLKQQPSFCIHFYPNDEGREGNHGPWKVESSMPDGRICWTSPSPLIYLLGRALHNILSRGTRNLTSIHNMVSSILDAPAAKCMVCSRTMGCRLWRPTVCSSGCSEKLQLAPLEVTAAPLLSDPQVFDFLLSCIYAATKQTSLGNDLLPGCPFTAAKVREVIDSFPPLPANARPSEILSQIRAGNGSDEMPTRRALFLSWMCVEFQGCLVTAPQNSRVLQMPGTQFLVLNGSPSREKGFSRHLGRVSTGGTSNGGVTFHGAVMGHLWRTLTQGISSQLSTRPGVKGISLADEPGDVDGLCGDLNIGAWQNSAFSNRKVMLVCELAGHTNTRQGSHVVSEEEKVAVRYVLLYPKGHSPPKASGIVEGVKRTLAGLRDGVL